MADTINDRIAKLLAELSKTESAMNQVNDYGDVTGFCYEWDSINQDAFNNVN